MKNKFIILFIALLISQSTALFCFENKNIKLREENLILEAELALARQPLTYLVFDLSEKAIHLKARGMELKKWDIHKIKYWGNPLSLRTFLLKRKSAWFPPKRNKIKPGKNDEEDSIKLDVFEQKDMPSYYKLVFDGGVRISIRPKTHKFFSLFRNFGRSLNWHIFLPLKTVWLSIRKKNFTEIDIVLPSNQDTKALYWTFQEGQNCLITYRHKS